MHEIAATVGSASIILIGIIFGILYNQRSVDRTERNLNDRMDRMERHFEARIDRLEAHVDRRFDKIQDDLSTFHRSLGQHDKALEILEKRAS